MQNDIAISINALQKIYENGFKALEDINLEIRQGEIFALLGPNGAGKTTLINAICGIVQPTNGTVTHPPIPTGTQRGGFSPSRTHD
ncbi:ATP-binding cassette domain-containing protein [Legionella rowbothamii]|uniref:ATP-binding cassette domain-containing protein n=1 Tax=Legionella rowbothamii TaxID=96229 RepID=UPI001A951C9A|nr:ATP-binding cassette domain-containing protein [Legionella rowbothamii]